MQEGKKEEDWLLDTTHQVKSHGMEVKTRAQWLLENS